MDNRLDFISNIDEEGIQLMTDMRKCYIVIDEALRDFAVDGEHPPLIPSSNRTLALARTNLEISLQYAIKTLCIMYEKKEEEAEKAQ